MGLGFLHHPALNEFALLTGIAAVHYAVGFLHKAFDDVELLFVGFVVYKLYSEALGYHRQAAE